MLTSGLTSVTFRKYEVEKVACLARQAGLKGMEWGGDIHVPPMNKAAIKRAVSATQKEGLKTFSYGSYYSPMKEQDYLGEAEKIFETCRLLECARVRVWAGDKWRNEATDREYGEFVARMRRVGELALRYGVTVCFEHHQNTFCDSGEHALSALRDIAKENVRTYWQPIQPATEENLACLALLKEYTDTVHVYHWTGWDRHLLSEGKARWQNYLRALHGEEREIPCLIEFTKDDAEENFFSDAECLLSLLSNVD